MNVLRYEREQRRLMVTVSMCLDWLWIHDLVSREGRLSFRRHGCEVCDGRELRGLRFIKTLLACQDNTLSNVCLITREQPLL